MAPAEIDLAMAVWLPRSIASSVRERLYDGPPDPAWTCAVVGYDLELDGAEPHQDLAHAGEILDLLNLPATTEHCAKELARLKVLTKCGRQTADDLAFQIAVMAEELTAYPADVVRDACRFYAKTSTWFPGWSELRDLCETRVMKRRCLLNALRRYFR